MSNPAEGYENYMVPALFAPWSSVLIQAANLQPGDRVLDVGCGTGIVARRVAAINGTNGTVIGLDPNPNMIDVARSAAEREDVKIEWREGSAEMLPFPDNSFDLVLSQFAMMFFSDRPAALSEMNRVLDHGGRVVLSVFQSLDRHPFYQTLDEAIQQRLGLSGVADIFILGNADELHTLLLDAGFQNVTIEPASLVARFPFPDAFLTGEIEVDTAAIPAMQHLDAQARQNLVAAIREDMETAMREVTEGDFVVLPFHTYMVHAER